MTPRPESSDARRGIFWMILTTLLGAGMDATAMYLVRDHPVLMLLWARITFHVLFLVLLLGPRLPRVMVTRNLRLHLVRSVMQVLAVGFMFWSLRYISLADASAIYLASPIFTTALAVPFLGETVGPRRWIGVGVGFLGALLIIRPGTDIMQAGALLALGASLSAAVLQITTRLTSRTDGPLTTLAYTTLVGFVLFNLTLPLYWVTPSAEGWLGLVTLAVFGFAATYTMIKSFEAAPASVVTPYYYTGMAWAIVLGAVLFGQWPDAWSSLGIAVIAGSGLYIFHRERVRKSAAPPD
ncbi:MAG: DMT family transporter [Rhodospirillales bacterium]|nr:DMT family transporter [Rhodospirillales bacterium]